MIWQNIIEVFINKHFSGIDPNTGAALFDMSIKSSNVKFADKTYDDIDDSVHHFSIDIDGFRSNLAASAAKLVHSPSHCCSCYVIIKVRKTDAM